MAVQPWYNLSLLFGARAIAAQAKTFLMNGSCEALDTTPLSSTDLYSTFIAGKKTVTMEFDIMSDFTTSATEGTDTVYPQKNVSDYITASNQGLEARSICLGRAVGSTAYLGDSLFTSYTILTGNVGELAMGRLAATYSGTVARGMLAHDPTTARASTGSGTALQLGTVSSSQRLYANLHVLNASGSAGDQTLAVKVQSDNAEGFGSATDRITFTTATGLTEQHSSAAGAITDDWWRVQWTIAGAGTESFLFAVTFGIA